MPWVDVEEPGRERRVGLRQPPRCSSSCSARTTLTPFRSAFTPIASPSPPGRDREGPVAAAPGSALDDHLQPAPPGRHRRDRQWPRGTRRLNDDRPVRAEARLADARERAERVLEGLLADDRMQLELASQVDPLVGASALGG